MKILIDKIDLNCMAEKWDNNWSLADILRLIDGGFDSLTSNSAVQMRRSPLEPINASSVVKLYIARKMSRKTLEINQWYA